MLLEIETEMILQSEEIFSKCLLAGPRIAVGYWLISNVPTVRVSLFYRGAFDERGRKEEKV